MLIHATWWRRLYLPRLLPKRLMPIGIAAVLIVGLLEPTQPNRVVAGVGSASAQAVSDGGVASIDPVGSSGGGSSGEAHVIAAARAKFANREVLAVDDDERLDSTWSAPSGAAEAIWTGADGDGCFSSGGNWADGRAPGPGENLRLG